MGQVATRLIAADSRIASGPCTVAACLTLIHYLLDRRSF